MDTYRVTGTPVWRNQRSSRKANTGGATESDPTSAGAPARSPLVGQIRCNLIRYICAYTQNVRPIHWTCTDVTRHIATKRITETAHRTTQ